MQKNLDQTKDHQGKTLLGGFLFPTRPAAPKNKETTHTSRTTLAAQAALMHQKAMISRLKPSDSDVVGAGTGLFGSEDEIARIAQQNCSILTVVIFPIPQKDKTPEKKSVEHIVMQGQSPIAQQKAAATAAQSNSEKLEDKVLNQLHFIGGRKLLAAGLCTELLDGAPEEVRTIVDNLSFPELAAEGTPSGMILVGPPGTGKTDLAKAIAQKSGRSFLPILTGALVDQFQGSGEQHILEVVDFVASLNKPYVILLDETQSVTEGKDDRKNSNYGVAILVWQLMDKHKKEPNLFFVGTTNEEEHIPAPLKSRIKTFTIPLPDATARRHIISYYLYKHSFDNAKIGKTCDQSCVEWLISATNKFSGRDICDLITTAVSKAFSQRVRKGEITRTADGNIRVTGGVNTVVQRKDIEAALPEVRAKVNGKTDWKWWREKSAWAWQNVLLPVCQFGANAWLQKWLQDRQIELQKRAIAMQEQALEKQERGLGMQGQGLEKQERGLGMQEKGLEKQERGLEKQERGLGMQEEGLKKQERGLQMQNEALQGQRLAFTHQRLTARLPYYHNTWDFYPNMRCAKILERFERSAIPQNQQITEPAVLVSNTGWALGTLDLENFDESNI